MRICLLTTLHSVDDDVVYYKHAKSLAKRFRDITLIAPKSKLPANAEDGAIKFRWLNPGHSPLDRPWRLVQAMREVRRLRPDLCHFYDLDVLGIVPWLRQICKAGLIYSALEAWPERMLCAQKIPKCLRPMASWCTDVMEKRIARWCSLVLTADEATARDFAGRVTKAQTLFNFPPLALFDPEVKLAAQVPQRYQTRTIAIYHGTMTEDRGLFHMLRATRLVATQKQAFLLMLIGLQEGDLKRRALALIDELKIGDHVEIMPWIPHVQMAAYLRMAKVGLAPLQPIPKYYKNIPQKIFEYMACGVPVIGADLPTIAPFVRRADAGVVVDCVRPELLANAIMRLLEDDLAWNKMSQNGRRAFIAEYNWESMEKRLFSCYEELQRRWSGEPERASVAISEPAAWR
jgi:glycosyltransferase involved in cell wall biosynthesis